MPIHNCDRCRDRIGVWEPAIFVVSEAHATTQAARPELATEASERYHRDCYTITQERTGDRPV
jgi:hypothetical protein